MREKLTIILLAMVMAISISTGSLADKSDEAKKYYLGAPMKPGGPPWGPDFINGPTGSVLTKPEEIILGVHDLRLMSVKTTDELEDEGRSLLIVALVGDVDGKDLHIRIFDASGEKVFDKAEKQLESGETLTALKQQLTALKSQEDEQEIIDGSSLSLEDKQEIIRNATSTSEDLFYRHPFDWLDIE